MGRCRFAATWVFICWFLLAGCGGLPPIEVRLGSSAPVAPVYTGLIAADESRAVLAAKEILGARGGAADAAAALGFALAVTLPSAAGLGGGGACLVHDAAHGTVQALTFISGANPPDPLLARGLRTLHAKYGTLPWAQVIAPAERLARFGHPISRALADDMGDGNLLLRDPQVFASFLNPRRELLSAGDIRLQPELAALLERVRGGDDLTRSNLNWETLSASLDGVVALSGGDGESAEGSTGFVVSDASGNAVACVLTMGKLFGAGSRAAGQNYLMAAPIMHLPLSYVAVALAPESRRLRWALAARGAGAVEEAATVQRMLAKEQAISDLGAGLLARTHSVRINVLGCRTEAATDRFLCEALTDPRGLGYAVMMGERP